MLFLLSVLLAAASTARALSEQCDNGETCNDPQSYCIATSFCISSDVSDVALFVAGMSSAFVDQGDLQAAECLEQAEEDIGEFVSALNAWQNNDPGTAWTDLGDAVSAVSGVVSTCSQTTAKADGSFWDDIVDAVEVVGTALCPECAEAITDTEFVIAGVNIIDDWVAMYQDCTAGDAADIVACGAAFGDSVKIIYQQSSAAAALSDAEPKVILSHKQKERLLKDKMRRRKQLAAQRKALAQQIVDQVVFEIVVAKDEVTEEAVVVEEVAVAAEAVVVKEATVVEELPVAEQATVVEQAAVVEQAVVVEPQHIEHKDQAASKEAAVVAVVLDEVQSAFD